MAAETKIHLAIRGFGGGMRQFEDRVELEEADLGTLLIDLAMKHAITMAVHDPHMIEIGFLDEPDPDQRFFRFGTDPSAMVLPARLRHFTGGAGRPS